jgi:hypothetical protein
LLASGHNSAVAKSSFDPQATDDFGLSRKFFAAD